jgi:uncharacterized membrane protein YgcG
MEMDKFSGKTFIFKAQVKHAKHANVVKEVEADNAINLQAQANLPNLPSMKKYDFFCEVQISNLYKQFVLKMGFDLGFDLQRGSIEFPALLKMQLGKDIFTAFTASIPYVGVLYVAAETANNVRKIKAQHESLKLMRELKKEDFKNHAHYKAVTAVIQYQQEKLHLETEIAAMKAVFAAARLGPGVHGVSAGSGLISVFATIMELAFQYSHVVEAREIIKIGNFKLKFLKKAPLLGIWMIAYEDQKNLPGLLAKNTFDSDKKGRKPVRARKAKPRSNQFKAYSKAVESAQKIICEFPFQLDNVPSEPMVNLNSQEFNDARINGKQGADASTSSSGSNGSYSSSGSNGSYSSSGSNGSYSYSGSDASS